MTLEEEKKSIKGLSQKTWLKTLTETNDSRKQHTEWVSISFCWTFLSWSYKNRKTSETFWLANLFSHFAPSTVMEKEKEVKAKVKSRKTGATLNFMVFSSKLINSKLESFFFFLTRFEVFLNQIRFLIKCGFMQSVYQIDFSAFQICNFAFFELIWKRIYKGVKCLNYNCQNVQFSVFQLNLLKIWPQMWSFLILLCLFYNILSL